MIAARPEPGNPVLEALDAITEALEPLGLEDADAVLEAARIVMGVRAGPTTADSAEMVLRERQRRWRDA